MNKLRGIWEVLKQLRLVIFYVLGAFLYDIVIKPIIYAEYPVSYTGKIIAIQHQGGFYSPDFTHITLSDGTVLTLKGVWDLDKGETYTIDGTANKELRGITVQKIRTE